MPAVVHSTFLPAALRGLLLAVLVQAAAAAPSEGTAGQTVTARNVHRTDVATARQLHDTTAKAPPLEARPLWTELTAAQQQALRPLAPYWSRLPEERKRKWLAISRNYPSMSPQEQAKLHQRMTQWITLPRQQKAQARQSYQQLHVVPREQRSAEWQAYQALSAEEKRRLAAQAGAKPTTAPLIKPAAKPKLAAIAGPRWADAPQPPIHHPTLLPQPMRQPPPAPSPYEDDPAE